MKKNIIQVSIGVLKIILISALLTSSCIGMLHQVKKGETLSEIARKYEVPMKSIAQTNSLKSMNHLQIGDKLLIPARSKPISSDKTSDGIWHTVMNGDSLYSIAQSHGIKDWKYLQSLNSISNPRHIRIGQKIYIPVDTIDSFAKPLRIPLYITSRYGYRRHPVNRKYMMHKGIDFRAATGTKVYASKTGRVVYAAWERGYGRIVRIEHADNYSTCYAHLSRFQVSVGDIVKQGEVIGLSGNTGVSTGPHLHFEIRYKGKSENPARHLDLP